jgi:hypothetical protein
MKAIYIQLEDLRHLGDAGSDVNVDLDHNGARTLTVYAGLFLPSPREPLGGLGKRLVFEAGSDWCRSRTGRGAICHGSQRSQLRDR